MPLDCSLDVLQIMLYPWMVEDAGEPVDSLAVRCGPFDWWKGP